MRLWRLLIYFTLLSVYFICVENGKGGWWKKNNSQIVDSAPPNDETEALLIPELGKNDEENEKKIFDEIKSFCDVKYGRKRKFFDIVKKKMLKIFKFLPKEAQKKVEECCKKINDNDLNSLEDCGGIVNGDVKKISESKEYKEFLQKEKERKNNPKKRFAWFKNTKNKLKAKVYRIFRDLLSLKNDEENEKEITEGKTNVRRRKRGVAVKVVALSAAGFFCVFLAISSFSLGPVALIAVPLFGGLAGFCVVLIKKELKKHENTSHSEEVNIQTSEHKSRHGEVFTKNVMKRKRKSKRKNRSHGQKGSNSRSRSYHEKVSHRIETHVKFRNEKH
ncbi:hypothetical protein ACQ4LE_010524 [Meloidogyne hapla]